MTIEIVEFYPLKYNKFLGTIHIYLIEDNIDLRGIKVIEIKKGKYFFKLPGTTTIDEEGNKIYYPFFSYLDKEKHTRLVKEIVLKGTKYVNLYLKENKNEKNTNSPRQPGMART